MATAYPYGYIQRAKPKLQVLRGYDNPQKALIRKSSFPVTSGVTIKSGQVIYSDWNSANARYEWKLGCELGKTPYLANADSDDEDVISAGTLPGLSCAGQFEFRMPYFKTGETYQQDIPLTYDGTTGNVKPTTWGAGVPVLGILSRNHDVENLAGKDASAVNLDVVTFNSHYDETNGPRTVD